MMSPMDYTNWAPGQPDNEGDSKESCMHLYSGMSYKWNDHMCNIEMCAICEIDTAAQ